MAETSLISSTLMAALSGLMISTLGTTTLTSAETTSPTGETRFRLLSDAEAWRLLPLATNGAGHPLPTWARMLASELPRTSAALLQLDLAQRTKSPVAPELRAAMRWVAAHANHCIYAEADAAADALRAGVSPSRIEALGQAGYPGWSESEQKGLAFARQMTVDSDAVTDEDFSDLVQHFGEKQAASMVLLMAYANFQDRLLLSLGAPLEATGPTPAVDLEFTPESFVFKTTPVPVTKISPLLKPTGSDLVEDDPEWQSISYETLQQRLEVQRQMPTRLRVPSWDEVARNLPAGLMKQPSDIVWYRIVFGYAPELAVPFEVFMRTAGAETSSQWDRIFGQSLFWVTTRAVKCPYCMGHCEMNWEVAGLSRDEIAARSRLLASDDWSSFTPAEQHAFAFARKLTKTPWQVSSVEVGELQQDFGVHRAMIVLLNASRYHYMTRISNGFQLTLERENVFYDYYNMKSPKDAAGSPAVALLSSAECWQRLPATVLGRDQELPSWTRAVATQLPRTAAAMLQLDFAHRTQSPLDPVLRGKLRWVVAHANRCTYGEAYALADLTRIGLDEAGVKLLTGDPSDWADADREPLEFARLLTVAAPTIPDEMFESLRVRFGEKPVAAMVLLAAYGNFQDRVILGLRLPLEPSGPLPPLAVTFAEGALQVAPLMPTASPLTGLTETGENVVAEDENWSRVSYEQLQTRLDQQRHRKPRLPIPTWEQVKQNIPPAMATRPTRIVWNLVCSGYVPELAVPWGISTRTMWAESKSDRIFEESLFWVQTRSIECNYCMGHCEMLLEVAGLDKPAVAERTRRLAGKDWSSFPPEEQRAYAYARKLSQTPWKLTSTDYHEIEKDLGPERAMATFWWLCRGLYMTRVSDGFQLPLETENVFEDPAVKKPDADRAAPK